MARIGARYALSNNQDLLLSSSFIDRFVTTLENANTELEIKDTDKSHGFVTEAQHLYRHEFLNTVSGGSIYQFTSNGNPDVEKNRRMDRYNAYTYAHVNYFRNLNLTFGLSYDAFTSVHDDSKSTGKINPKLGLQWNITNSLRLRLGWFETTKNHLIAQQTLEPTQIAGFNQFYDDPNGTRTQRSGAGIDYNVQKNLYSGIEISQRKLAVPFPGSKQNPITTEFETTEELEKQTENLYRAYLYWLPHKYWSIKNEFQFEHFSRSINSTFLTTPSRIQTFKIPFEIDFFHPTGIFSKFAFTIVDQNINRKIDDEIIRKSNDTFFLVDYSMGYRLPNRRGIINLEARNLLDSQFDFRNINFYQSEPVSSRFIPDRTFLLNVTLNF
jgi:hypothetical protein